MNCIFIFALLLLIFCWEAKVQGSCWAGAGPIYFVSDEYGWDNCPEGYYCIDCIKYPCPSGTYNPVYRQSSIAACLTCDNFMRILVHYQVIKFVELVIQVLIALEIILEYVLLALLHVLLAHIGVLIVQHHQTECVYLVH